MNKEKKQNISYILFILAGIFYILSALTEHKTILTYLTGLCFIIVGSLYFINKKK